MNNTQNEELVGQVTHYFGKAGVAIVRFSKPFRTGETLHCKGTTTDFSHAVLSMEMEHQAIDEAKPGDEIGIKVDEKVREGDQVFRVLQ